MTTYQVLDFTGRRIGGKGLAHEDATLLAKRVAWSRRERTQVVPDHRDLWPADAGELHYPPELP